MRGWQEYWDASIKILQSGKLGGICQRQGFHQATGQNIPQFWRCGNDASGHNEDYNLTSKEGTSRAKLAHSHTLSLFTKIDRDKIENKDERSLRV